VANVGVVTQSNDNEIVDNIV